MGKGKVKLGDYEMNGFVFMGMMLILIFCSLILGVSMTLSNSGNSNSGNLCIEDINIPDGNMINSFCKSNGYEYGWLSSTSCGTNEVQCFKQVGDAKYYDCINIKQAKQ